MNSPIDNISTFKWWSRRLLSYNISLALAGATAFVCYATVIFLNTDVIPDADITLFTTLFQAVGYLFMMGVANVCFFAGPLSEKLIRPKNVDRFRIITYRLGYWFSISLPFGIPALLLYLVLFHPEYWTNS